MSGSFGENILINMESNIQKVLIGDFPLTRNQIKAKQILIEMLNSLPTDSYLYLYITNKIIIHYELTAKNDSGKLIPNQIFLWKNLDPKSLPFFEGGVYLFRQTKSGHDYIGAAASHCERAMQHQSQFTGHYPTSLHKLEGTRIDTLEFGVVYKTPNFLKQFKLFYPEYKLTLGEYEILMAITVYPQRVLEQHLIDYYKPYINGRNYLGKQVSTTVIYPYVSWDPTRLNMKSINYRGAIPNLICDLQGNILYKSSSLYETSYFLEKSPRNIKFYINNVYSIYSEKLNQDVFLRTIKNKLNSSFDESIDSLADISFKPLDRVLVNTEELILVNKKLEDLSPIYYYAFLSNKIDFLHFINQESLFAKLFPKQYADLRRDGKKVPATKLKSRFNLNVPITSEYGVDYYLATHPENLLSFINSKNRSKSGLSGIKDSGKKRVFKDPIWVLNIIKNNAELAANLRDASSIVSAKDSNLTITLGHVGYLKDTGKIYKKTYLFISNTIFLTILNRYIDASVKYVLLDKNEITRVINYKFMPTAQK